MGTLCLLIRAPTARPSQVNSDFVEGPALCAFAIPPSIAMAARFLHDHAEQIAAKSNVAQLFPHDSRDVTSVISSVMPSRRHSRRLRPLHYSNIRAQLPT